LNPLAVFPDAFGFEVFHAFAGSNPSDELRLFGDTVRREEHGDRPTDRFRDGVSEHLFGAGIPGRDGSVEGLREDRVRRRLDDRSQPAKCLLVPPPFGYLAKHHDGTHDAPVVGVDRRGAVIDGNFSPVLREQQSMVRKARDRAFAEHLFDWVVDRAPRLLVDDNEDLRQPPADRFGVTPARQRLGDRVHEGDAPRGISRDDGVPDTRERRSQPLTGCSSSGGCAAPGLIQSADHTPQCRRKR
jgi:hypothetical protein